MRFDLQTFGKLELQSENGDQIPFPEKGLLILCYLLDRPGGQASRAAISALLWNECLGSDTKAALRQTLVRIKSRQAEIGFEFLKFDSEWIWTDSRMISADFRSAVADAHNHPIRELERLTTLFHAPFLADIDGPGPTFINWVDEKRRLYLDLLVVAVSAASVCVQSKADRMILEQAAANLLRHGPEDNSIREFAGEILANRRKELRASLSPAAARSTNGDAVAQSTEDAAMAHVPSDLPRLALLPPVKTGKSIDIRARALIEDITIGLCSWHTVAIVAPYTADRISRSSSRETIISKQRIAYVLDTRISEYAGDSHLFVQLVHFASDQVIWADRLPLGRFDLLHHRKQMVWEITGAIAQQVERNEHAREYFEEDPRAYHAYLLGKGALKRFALPDTRRARKAFGKALQFKSGFSPALSGVAWTFFVEWMLTARGDDELLQQAANFAAQAVDNDFSMATGFRELGVIKLYSGKIDESLEALSKAEMMSPHHADVKASYADALVHASRPREALEKIEQAILLNPLCPDEYWWAAAGAHFNLGEYEKAIETIDKMAMPAPADRLKAACWAMAGNPRRAGIFRRKALENHPDFDVDKWISLLPIKGAEHQEHYRQALRRAGF